jgi:hypothetical protein
MSAPVITVEHPAKTYGQVEFRRSIGSQLE